MNAKEKDEIKARIEKEKNLTVEEIDCFYQRELEIKKEKMMLLYKEISTLQSEVISQMLEKGQNNLYVGYPFIEGKILDDSNIRGPIFLFPMKLEKREDGWYLLKRANDSILFNKTFYLAYKTVYEENIEDFDGEFEGIQDIIVEDKLKDLIDISKKYLEDKKIKFSSEPDLNLEEMKNYLKDDFKNKYPSPELKIKRYLVLGDYAISENAIYKDYENIMQSKESSLADILLAEERVEVGDENREGINIQIQEKECHFVTELDYSQEKAIKLVEKKGSLVVYGPPGTGKSQVIANLVSDNLAKGKKVLVVSEKRTALDVVYKRLEACGLSQRMAFIHDSKSDRGILFQKVAEIMTEVYSGKNKMDNSIDQISINIQTRLDNFDKLAKKIHKKGRNGLSLFQLYSLSDAKLDQIDFVSEIYKDFKDIKNEELEEIFKNLAQLYKNLDFDKDKNFYLKNRNSFSGITEIDLNYMRQRLKSLEMKNYSLAIKDCFENIKRDIQIIQDLKNQEFEEYKRSTIKNMLNIFWSNLEKEKEFLEKELENMKRVSITIMEEIINKEEKFLKNISFYEEEVKSLEKFYPKEIFLKIEEINEEIKSMERIFFLSPRKYLLKSKIEKSINGKISEEKNNIERWNTLKRDFKILFEEIEYKETKNFYISEISRKKDKSSNLKVELEKSFEFLKKLTTIEELLEDKVIKTEIEFPHDFNQYIIKINDYLKESDIVKRIEILEIKISDIEGIKNNFNVQYLEEVKKNIKKREIERVMSFERLEGIKKNIESMESFTYNSIIEMKNVLETEEKKVVLGEELLLENFKNSRVIIVKVEEEFSKIKEFKKYFNEFSFELMKENIFENRDRESIIELQNYLNNFSSELISHDYLKDNLSVEGKIIYRHILDEKSIENSEKYLRTLKNSFYLEWIRTETLGNNELLSYIDRYEDSKKQIVEMMSIKKKLIPNFIIKKLDSEILKRTRYSTAGNELHYKDMLKEVQKKRKLLPLRKFVDYFSTSGLFDILPCWLLAPEVVSEIMPTKSGLFDLVIFDEASQMLVERGIPSIYRGKNVVVAGDDKQLQPTTIGQKTIGTNDNADDEMEEVDENEEYQDTTALTEKSLLDMAKLRYASSKLSFHYRAKYEELINFSNYAFYNGELQTPPNLSNDSKEPPIKRIKVNGEWRNRTNEREAEEIYGLVKEILLNRNENESIGIITFNASQQEFIREYLEEKAMQDAEFRIVYSKELERYDETEDKSLFIKNIENVQGDERDIIIFSVAYAKDSNGRLKTQFGSLSQQGGENRLNVAISRAKKKIYLVTSFEPEELMVENSKNLGPKLLKKYLQYARAVSSDDKDSAKSILNGLSREIKTPEVQDSFDSIFEEQVCEALRAENLKFEIHTQIGDSGYRVDLGVFDKETSSYVLGIECDGATYHSTPSARERDIYRQKFLESKGWRIHRIWSRDWWGNPEKEIEKILKKLHR